MAIRTLLKLQISEGTPENFLKRYGEQMQMPEVLKDRFMDRSYGILLYIEYLNRKEVYLVEHHDQVVATYTNFPKAFKLFVKVPVAVLDQRVGQSADFPQLWQFGHV